MTYQEIEKVNGEMTLLPIKGKNYAMVPERVTAFRKLYPQGFITTEIVNYDGKTVTMRATVGHYEEGNMIVLGTGFAQEERGKGMINATSFVENCETSAVGRALGFLGLGINGGGICSAEELANAITAQGQMQAERKPDKLAIATVLTLAKQKGVGDDFTEEGYTDKDGNKVPWSAVTSVKMAAIKKRLMEIET